MKKATLYGARRRQSTSTGRLREEIALIEQRLARLGHDGDCGYENAIIRFYERELGLRRAQLVSAER
jgi:hypothetical protein